MSDYGICRNFETEKKCFILEFGLADNRFHSWNLSHTDNQGRYFQKLWFIHTIAQIVKKKKQLKFKLKVSSLVSSKKTRNKYFEISRPKESCKNNIFRKSEIQIDFTGVCLKQQCCSIHWSRWEDFMCLLNTERNNYMFTQSHHIAALSRSNNKQCQVSQMLLLSL